MFHLCAWLPQCSSDCVKCVTVIWTAETRHILMYAQLPTPICLQSYVKAVQSTEKNIQGKCSPQAMVLCLGAWKDTPIHTVHTIICFQANREITKIYRHTKTAIENKWGFTLLKSDIEPFEPSLGEVITFSQYASSKKVQCFYPFSLIWHLYTL